MALRVVGELLVARGELFVRENPSFAKLNRAWFAATPLLAPATGA